MSNLILINFEKKMSFISFLFMIISIATIYAICVYNASFNLSEYYLLDQWEIVVDNYLVETLQLVEFIGVIFIVLLVELELFYNTDNFDSYFVVLKGKKSFYVAKIFSYIVIILLYTSIIFSGFLLIYIIRFRNIFYCELILECYIDYLLYFGILFLVSFSVMLLFKNYFSVILVFLYYWGTKIIDYNSILIQTILPKIEVDIAKKSVNMGSNNGYLLLFMAMLYIINMYIYTKKDMKIHS